MILLGGLVVLGLVMLLPGKHKPKRVFSLEQALTDIAIEHEVEKLKTLNPYRFYS